MHPEEDDGACLYPFRMPVIFGNSYHISLRHCSTETMDFECNCCFSKKLLYLSGKAYYLHTWSTFWEALTGFCNFFP
jgi:hypothetical protein